MDALVIDANPPEHLDLVAGPDLTLNVGRCFRVAAGFEGVLRVVEDPHLGSGLCQGVDEGRDRTVALTLDLDVTASRVPDCRGDAELPVL